MENKIKTQEEKDRKFVDEVYQELMEMNEVKADLRRKYGN